MHLPWRTMAAIFQQVSFGKLHAMDKLSKSSIIEYCGKWSELEPKLVKKRTSSKKRVKKTVTIYAEDNIILGPDIATHARIVTESIPTPARRRTFDPPKKLKSVLSLITEEQEVANIMTT
ncbi:hypothetical protein Tco_1466751 [Tanacetum coccineum]